MGYAKYWNEVHIDGNIEDWDFIAYYSFYDEVDYIIVYIFFLELFIIYFS